MGNRVNYFMPYTRQGLTTLADHRQSSAGRLQFEVNVFLEGKDGSGNKLERTVRQKIVLLGPGDILGVDPRIISRVAPPPDTNSFEASLTPFIEFNEPDFLWRFSTRQAADGENWLPWLTLIILKRSMGAEEGEFVTLQNDQADLPPRIQVKPNAVLPDLNESWRWAHVHMLETQGLKHEDLKAAVARSSKNTVCRLMSPRRLEPETAYEVFLVPTFRLGVQVALGLATENTDRKELSWDTPAAGAGQQLPYYYRWSFRTGTKGDFEYLVRKLQPRKLRGLGIRKIDCRTPGFGIEPEITEMEMEAALKSLDVAVQSWGMDNKQADGLNATQRDMANLLNSSEQDDILRVAPPVYGEWYAERSNAEEKLVVDQQHWLEEINLDFRHRAAAGLGVQFVKQNQEKLMQAAWTQLNKVQEVNRRLNLGRFGRSISKSLHRRMEKMNPDHLWKLALPVQNKMLFSEEEQQVRTRGVNNSNLTIGAHLRASEITNKLVQVKVKKYLPKKRSTAEAGDESGAVGSVFFTPVTANQLVSQAFQVAGTTRKTPQSSSTLFQIEDKNETSGDLFNTLGAKMKMALDPKETIQVRLANRVRRIRTWEKHRRYNEEDLAKTKSRSDQQSESELDPLRPVLWYPEFHRPMYHFLRDLSQEYILAGVEHIPQDTVGLLAANRRFIEAYMLGVNHEFASELRWREFPTDLRGSYFRSFWDTSIYSVDEKEEDEFWENSQDGIRLLAHIHREFGTHYDREMIVDAYTTGEPSDTQKAVAAIYEEAVEKWLLSRDEDKDIAEIADWKKNSRLGEHPAPGTWTNNKKNVDALVLVVRGELLQKFENTLIYLVNRNAEDSTQPDLSSNAGRKFPVFEGALPPDMIFIGFPITTKEVGDYFLIFEERITDLRLGLDIDASGNGENDLSWLHFEDLHAGDYLNGRRPANELASRWDNAAFIGKVMYQKQVRVAIELSRMVPERLFKNF
ncbi:hypothetical protein [Flavilitoribacter nigricans]|uniref:Uncharacterized protein n=1 Tax=Flavilitoribacter nigricans (strain ATCC 23147 / DSM 23189 / NBRC 102662 / NCIMB 1420 / SS-2) TaxID=1122177 RepID=A0A2D0N0I0_FLAN2|nr:hypothetical protein [Flavilitoribacter nigricans]PHN01995.1 hypothetical protein CRP01_34380 [Flavilitoribacter nigricans DSM 23189 = NBRC 102662]